MEGPAVAAAPSPEEERLLIRDITVAAEAHAKEGDTFFLITHRWWQQWLDYVNQDSVGTTNNGSSSYSSQYYEAVCSSIPNRPLAIDNSDLIDDIPSEVSSVEIELHDTLVEGRDYILLPQEVWEKLHGWYGGGPILPRKAIINSGFSQTDLAIEVYPLRLQLILTTKGDRAIVRISKKETVGELHRKACEVFDLIVDQVSIWDYYGHQKHLLMDDLERTLDDANIQMVQDGFLQSTPKLHAMHLSSQALMQNTDFLVSGLWRISEIGQIGFFIEARSGSKEKKAWRHGGMKNWYVISTTQIKIHHQYYTNKDTFI